MQLRSSVDTLCFHDPEFAAAANRFVSEMGGSNATYPVKKLDDIAAGVRSHVNVKFLIFDTHGSPGRISLPNGVAMAFDFVNINENQQFLAKNARILFLGCNVGEGAAGDKFLDTVGSYFLKGKGGFVGATTVFNWLMSAFSLSTETYMNPFGGRLKVRRFDAAGNPIASRSVNWLGTAD